MALHHKAKLTRQVDTNENDQVGPPQTFTGLVALVCNCGYASGWVSPGEIKDEIHEHLVVPGLTE